jgi:hypothetical protein
VVVKLHTGHSVISLMKLGKQQSGVQVSEQKKMAFETEVRNLLAG